MQNDATALLVTGIGGVLVSVTLVLFPQQLQPYAWLVRYVWVFWSGLVCMWLVSKLSPNAEKKVEPTPSQQAKAALADSGNATVTQHFNFSPITPITAPHLEQSPPQPPPNPPAKTLHVETLALEVRNVKSDTEHTWRFCSPKGDATPAVVLPILLDPLKSASRAEMSHVTSHLVFTDSESDRVVSRIGHGLWVNATALDYVDFAFGDTNYIIVALLKPDGSEVNTVSTNLTDYKVYNHEDEILFFEFFDLPIARYRVQVVLNWWNEKRTLDMELDLPSFTEKLKKESAER
jgi:hypothetical protein